MKIETKLHIANVTCVVSFLLLVVLVFTAPKFSGLALLPGALAGSRAAKWSAEIENQRQGQSLPGYRAKKSSLVRALEWAAAGIVLVMLAFLVLKHVAAK